MSHYVWQRTGRPSETGHGRTPDCRLGSRRSAGRERRRPSGRKMRRKKRRERRGGRCDAPACSARDVTWYRAGERQTGMLSALIESSTDGQGARCVRNDRTAQTGEQQATADAGQSRETEAGGVEARPSPAPTAFSISSQLRADTSDDIVHFPRSFFPAQRLSPRFLNIKSPLTAFPTNPRSSSRAQDYSYSVHLATTHTSATCRQSHLHSQ